jgi:glycosyltransferase involved in cell wall biosynthesis
VTIVTEFMALTALNSIENTGAYRIERGTRVAWAFPFLARTHYWQPVFREFSRLIPQTRIFTGLWGGFAPGYEGTFDLHIIKGTRNVTLRRNNRGEGYESSICVAPLSIVNEFAKFKPHVIFTTGFGVWTLCALLYRVITKAKVVVLWDGCSAYSSSHISRVRHWVRRCMAPLIDYGVSNMREGATYMNEVLGIPKKRLLSYPYQVADLAILDSGASDYSVPEGMRPAFLFVGAINARKGWRYLLQAADLLVKRGCDQFSVLFIGAGNQEDQLLADIRTRGLGSVAHYVGPVPYQKMASYYRQADVFVFPTTEDVWGLVLMEAMAFGLPVVCSKYAGSREMVEHEKNGFIVDPRDVETFARYMEEFIKNRGLISAFGVRSRERIAPFTSIRAAEVLASVALEARRAKKRNTHSFGDAEHDLRAVSGLPPQ